MDCEKILSLFRSELVTVNVGPKLLATSLEMQGYKAYQDGGVSAMAGGDKEMQEILDLLGGLE